MILRRTPASVFWLVFADQDISTVIIWLVVELISEVRLDSNRRTEQNGISVKTM